MSSINNLLNEIQSYSLIVLGLVNEGVYYVLIVLFFWLEKQVHVVHEECLVAEITTCVYIGCVAGNFRQHLILLFVRGGHLMKF